MSLHVKVVFGGVRLVWAAFGEVKREGMGLAVHLCIVFFYFRLEY